MSSQKPTYRLTELIKLLASGLCNDDHRRLSSIVREEQLLYTFDELDALQSMIELVSMNEGLKFKIEMMEIKYGKFS